MNKYELALVVSTRIEDDAREAVLEKAKALIEKVGGTISIIDEKGKQRLAYEIEKMKEGYYYFIQFEAAAEAPATMEASLRIMESVLRFLIVRQDAE